MAEPVCMPLTIRAEDIENKPGAKVQKEKMAIKQ